MIRFYDTNALLNLVDKAFEEDFVISSKTLEEIEYIKTSRNKDEEVKFNARQVARLIDKNQGKIKVIICNNEIYSALDSLRLDYSPDNIIMATASYYCNNVSPIVFVSDDINCKILAKNIFNLTVNGINEEDNFTYKGFKEVLLSEDDLAKFYENLRNNTYLCNVNEYLILKNEDNETQDVRRWTGEIYETVFNKNINSKLLGKIKPKDEFQKMAIDSMYNNMVTFISGKAGSGKSLLALTTAISLIENKKYRKLVIMFNPTTSKGSQELGFYKGDLIEKAKQSNIGQILNSKFGDNNTIDSLLLQDKLKLLPMADARGVEIRDDEILWISEGQNTTIEMMKLCLQRVSKNAKVFVEGDFSAQVDSYLYENKSNGMKRAIEILQGKSLFGYVELQNIHRSELAELLNRM